MPPPNVPSLLASWKQPSLSTKGKIIWMLSPLAFCWAIRKYRNNKIFEAKSSPVKVVINKIECSLL
uniref:Uncharacterized protein n=1 Tax=Nelumbo nucifera TaxID=4432 RepID=A0A822XD77_NELNU|nr:TPA_asm: hypothetical protein HUJ06_019295 [Nelumbo nucifera]